MRLMKFIHPVFFLFCFFNNKLKNNSLSNKIYRFTWGYQLSLGEHHKRKKNNNKQKIQNQSQLAELNGN